MVADRWTQTVRRQLASGRLLPLGGVADGAWIVESAAAGALRRAAATAVPDARLDTLRLSLADPTTAAGSAVPPPPSALPVGPLRVTADFAAALDRPLPVVADALRRAVRAAASETLGAVVESVDLRATELLEGLTAGAPVPEEVPPDPEGDAEVVRAVLSVPGVVGLVPLFGRAVRVGEGDGKAHAQAQFAVREGRRVLDTVREVRAAVAGVLAGRTSGPVTVAAVVTGVLSPGAPRSSDAGRGGPSRR
ncbi:nucleopolyhedrovirus P10 family protein [Streptomyces sp. NPDC051173]|uniref:nucleopolyhedrovirus P10 family protein n=1 Tax=Streptomyces sp. NPDC051173 TaxID=3155164 RepID=UPI003450A6BD